MNCFNETETYVDGTSCCKGPIEKRRQNTQYQDPDSNWVVACEYHFEEIQKYWEERWQEYWSDVL